MGKCGLFACKGQKIEFKKLELFSFDFIEWYGQVQLPPLEVVVVYWLQFGRYFARGPVERDDYALELAMDLSLPMGI
ncbi:hypothetical protein CsSME_00049827 [Camellia sinensis var. sinensis]